MRNRVFSALKMVNFFVVYRLTMRFFEILQIYRYTTYNWPKDIYRAITAIRDHDALIKISHLKSRASF